MNPKSGIVVLISGSGSNLQAIIDQVQQGHINGEIRAVISNRADAFGLERARTAGIPAIILDHRVFASREAFDQMLARTIEAFTPDVVVMAGFMRILTPEFVQQFMGRLINIHPALLPKYKGLDTHQRAIDAGDKEHGCTVHFVTAELDDGPNIIQAVVSIAADDDAKSLSVKVQQQEHIIYPLAVKWFTENRLSMIEGQAYFDGNILEQYGKIIDAR
ncbi:phosphoribosylglycinamide formyltransferase [Gynuella sunshinyii]|uniref:Phosphoribosylglycinamide formyltransferase n=1 Tax=Gynuella sunshinyii YC6258 TaxID=1445510 RepID=A0A0C5VME5_9GAMM|nr:phosphoribosylglycinamide formyltransferase [Gynuella sunshinyii]AJQ95897.1 folate-dependent phosphoribosylglycinamide formyltransferase PurN [Gynuella sunshinyii YC6258]